MHQHLLECKQTIATAESCTGGRIAALITAQSGASAYFQGGLVAYQNEVKEDLLGVPHEMIETHGVVSRQVVEAMVKGACRLLHSDYALASTGFAETSGDESVRIWIGWGNETEVCSLCLTEDRGRVSNVERAAEMAIDAFTKYLKR